VHYSVIRKSRITIFTNKFSNLNFLKLSIILQKGVIKIMTKELTVKFNIWRAMLRYAAAVT
jgi:hypothetical protein